MTESRNGSLDFEAIAGVIVIGAFSRLIGALVRGTIIIVGILTLLFEVVSIVLVYAFWLSSPLLIVVLLIWGVLLLIF